ARSLGHVALDLDPGVLGGRLLVPSLEPAQDAVEATVLAGAPEAQLPRRLRELLPGRVQAEATLPREHRQRLPEVDRFPPGPGGQGALGERLSRVGDDEVGIAVESGPQPPAKRAGPRGAVGGENA